jgi:peptide/nickel transport system permease protein
MSAPGQPAPAGATEIGTTSPAAVGAHPDEARLATKERLALLRRSKSFIAGSIIVGFWVLCAVFGELVVKDPLASDPINDLLAPSADHWFGTDKLGRDVFARVITGARDILIVAPLATILATVLGTALGLVTGYFRGAVDDVLSRIVEAFLALPVIIMGLLITVALGQSSKTSLILIIGVLFAPVISRTVRAAVLTEREMDYVAAARLRNERTPYVLFGEILPNVSAPIVVEFTVRLGYAIFTAAALSFLGFGIQPPAPDWGVQVFEHYGVISGGFWWPVLFPSLAIASLVIGVNLIADGVASAFER